MKLKQVLFQKELGFQSCENIMMLERVKGVVLELVSKEFNHLAAILHVYAWSLIFMK